MDKMAKTEQSHIRRLRAQGNKLAAANKKCAGTPNKQGQFYRCVKAELKKVFKWLEDNQKSNDLFLQEESISIAATDSAWKPLLKLNIPPNKKLYINSIIAIVDSGATPEGYFNVIVNGEKLVHNLASYNGALAYYFWGKPHFVLTKADTFEIQVKANGMATTAEASVSGLLFPKKK